MIEMLKKSLGQRKWFWPLLVAVAVLGLDLAGVQLERDTLMTVVVLVLGSTVGESAKDFIAILAPVVTKLRQRDVKGTLDELLELKESLTDEQIETLRGLMSEIGA